MAKMSKKYPKLTVEQARGTVNPETRRKREAAEAKRQASTEGTGGAKEQGKRVVKNKPKGGGQRGSEDEQRGSTRRPVRQRGSEDEQPSGGAQSKVISKIAQILQHAADVSSEGGERSSGSKPGAKFGPPHSGLKGDKPKSTPPKKLGSAKAKTTAADESQEVGSGRSGRVPRTLAKPGAAKFEGPPGRYRPKRGVTRNPSRK